MADMQTEAVAFATTHWSLVLIAQGESPAGKKPSKSSAAFTGDLSTLLRVGRGAIPMKRGI